MPLVNITKTSHTENHKLVTLKEQRENCWKIFGIMVFSNGAAIDMPNHKNCMQLCFVYV